VCPKGRSFQALNATALIVGLVPAILKGKAVEYIPPPPPVA
jgi:hypothetical protein